MEFRNPVVADGKIEDWMVLALNEMKKSNRYLSKKAIYDYGKVIEINHNSILCA